jgi:uncharacterized protein YbcI
LVGATIEVTRSSGISRIERIHQLRDGESSPPQDEAATPRQVRDDVDDRHPGEAQLTRGQLSSAVATSVVHIHAELVGRGPTRTRAILNDNLVVVLMLEALTKAELALAANGDPDAAREMRRQLQRVMRTRLTASIEALAGRRVTAMLSDTDPDADVAVLIFVLDEPPDTVRAAYRGSQCRT